MRSPTSLLSNLLVLVGGHLGRAYLLPVPAVPLSTKRLQLRDHPKVHSDRGCHYRWPGWIRICEEHGLVRSMSRKGRSPDNSRMEGFFGRLKVEFFFGHDWQDVSMEEFMETLDDYLSWYRDGRLKSDLGYMSPAQYRRSLGLAA